MAEVWTDVQRLKALQKQQANMAQDDIVKAVKTCMVGRWLHVHLCPHPFQSVHTQVHEGLRRPVSGDRR